MRVEEIFAHVGKRPFKPIRLFLSDGSAHDVRHPELVFVTRREVVIALPPMRGGIPERAVYIDPVHVTRIEPLNGRSGRRKPRGSR